MITRPLPVDPPARVLRCTTCDDAYRAAPDSTLEGTGMRLRLNTLATGIDAAGRRLTVRSPGGRIEELGYDALIVGTGALSVRPPIAGLSGPGALGPADGSGLT